jgi:hypothetical protein
LLLEINRGCGPAGHLALGEVQRVMPSASMVVRTVPLKSKKTDERVRA